MNSSNIDRFHAYLKSQDIQGALLSNPATLTWLTGYAPPIQTGPSPFEAGPALGWWLDGELTLILSDAEAGAVIAQEFQTRDYLSYTIDEPISAVQRQAAALKDVLSRMVGFKGKVGIEFNFLLSPMAEVFYQSLPDAIPQPLDGAFNLLRAVKTTAEIEKIRAALQLCDQAQEYVALVAAPGMTEIELWGGLKARLEATAKTRLPVLTDLVAGLRTAEIGGWPGDYQMQPGDPVIADIVPRLNGYWGDNAATHFLGEPSGELKKIYGIVRAALIKGIEAVRPGVRSCDLDQMLRTEIQAHGYAPYPHHSGHGIGVSFHEEPRLVPYNKLALQPGMVIAIEPGIYVPGVGGVRLEDVVLVTEEGCQVLTTHLLKG